MYSIFHWVREKKDWRRRPHWYEIRICNSRTSLWLPNKIIHDKIKNGSESWGKELREHNGIKQTIFPNIFSSLLACLHLCYESNTKVLRRNRSIRFWHRCVTHFYVYSKPENVFLFWGVFWVTGNCHHHHNFKKPCLLFTWVNLCCLTTACQAAWLCITCMLKPVLFVSFLWTLSYVFFGLPNGTPSFLV